jgi:hypothetical protein
MRPRRARFGIRAQLTLTVLLAAILTTLATLFIARNAIHNYAIDQAQTQQQESMSIATLVLETAYGQNISVSSDSGSDNKLVLDSPKVGRDQGTTFNNQTDFGRYPLNDDTDYVDSVQQRIHGSVSVYQCADKNGNFTQCHRIATTFAKPGASSTGSAQRDTGEQLCAPIIANLGLDNPDQAQHTWVGATPNLSCGPNYYGAYRALFNPQGQFIGVLFVGVPLDTVTAFEDRTALELILLGVIILTAGVILALLFASTIVNTMQRAARQVSIVSDRIGGIAAQQAGGAAQQVWAVNAVNKALHNFQDMARSISERTEQLALMGNQVIQRRAEISPPQLDSILAYMTRSVRDISQASKQQAAQYERMSGAMQAVIEIAEQVSGNSQQSTESAERLQLVVRQLQQLVGARRERRVRSEDMMDEGLDWQMQASEIVPGRAMMDPSMMDPSMNMPLGPRAAAQANNARRYRGAPQMGAPMGNGAMRPPMNAPMNGPRGYGGMNNMNNQWGPPDQEWNIQPMPPLPELEMPAAPGASQGYGPRSNWGRMSSADSRMPADVWGQPDRESWTQDRQ